MASIAELIIQIGANVDDFQKSMKQMEKDLNGLGSRMQEVGSNIASSFGTAGAGIATSLGFAVSKASDFEAQLSKVGAIAGASGEDLQALKETALELGSSTSKSALEVAAGMQNMASMGFSVNEVIAAMPGVISAAEASGEDMALTANTVATALRSFGLEASQATHVADVLAQTANSSAAGVGDLSETFKYAAPVANTLGISLETLAAATAEMADVGIKGSDAGTALRASLLRLADPPKEASDELQKLGVTIKDSQGNMLPFDQIVGQLGVSLEGMGNAQKAAALSAIFGQEAVSGMMAVIDAGPEKLRALTAELENSDGASQRTAAQMRDNLKGALDQLGGSFETMQITIGNALTPAITVLASALQGVADWFNNLSPSMQSTIAIGAAVTAGVLLLVGAFGGLIALAGSVVSGFAAIAPVLGTVAGVITSPLLVAIGALVAAGIAIYENWDYISTESMKIWDGLVAYFKPIISEIVNFFSSKFGEMKTWWDTNLPAMQQAFENIWNAILAFISPVLNAIKAAFDTAFPYIEQIARNTWEGIKSVISGALDIIKGAIDVFIGVFTGDWDKAWTGIKEIVSGAWEIVEGTLGTAINNISTAISGFIATITSYFTTLATNMIDQGKKLLDNFWSGIESMVSTVTTNVSNFATSLLTTAKNIFTEMVENGKYFVNQLWSGISSLVSTISTNVSNFATGLAKIISDMASGIIEHGKTFVNQLWAGINSLVSTISTNVTTFASGLSKIVSDMATGIIEHGKLFVNQLWSGISSLVETTKTNLSGFMTSLGNIVQQLATDMINYGKNIVEGLWKGIEEKVTWITDQVTGFAKSVGDTVKGYFDIHSPSKLMESYGEYVAEGLAVGIQNKTAEAAASAQAMAQAVMAPIQGALKYIQDTGWFENINGNWVQTGSGGNGDSPNWDGDWGDDDDGDGIPNIGDLIDDRDSSDEEAVGGEGGGRSDDPSDERYDGDGAETDPPDWHQDNYPGLANGGRVLSSGATWVGENGPELLDLPRGSRVRPLSSLDLKDDAFDYGKLAQAIVSVLKPSITIENNFNSSIESTSELARKQKRMLRELGLQY